MKYFINIMLVLFAYACSALTFAEVPRMNTPKTITIDTGQTEVFRYDETRCRMGILTLDCDPSASSLITIEKPWIWNLDAPDGVGAGIPFESAVPLGEYDLVLRDSPSKGRQWHFVNEDLGVYLEKSDRAEDWQRYSTMLHAANFVYQVVGCIGPGCYQHNFGGARGVGVTSSRKALLAIKQYLDGETKAKLRII